MPLIFNDNNLAVWQIDESVDALYARLERKKWYEQPLAQFKLDKRKREWLAVRVLLKELLGYEAEIAYRENGEPYLLNNSHYISVSHTDGYAAVYAHKEKRVGVDIESRSSDKILRIAHKFINPDREFISNHNKQLHLLLHWSAKETVFKALGKEGIDFARQLLVTPFVVDQEGASLQLIAKVDGLETYFTVFYYTANNSFVLTSTVAP